MGKRGTGKKKENLCNFRQLNNQKLIPQDLGEGGCGAKQRTWWVLQ